jgi:hypothetical protein
MMSVEFELPIKGYRVGGPAHQQESLTTSYALNVLPRDVSEKRLRLGKRPGFALWDETVLSAGSPVVAMCEVTIMKDVVVS